MKSFVFYKFWSKSYKMFQQWSHQHLRSTNGFLWRLLYLVGMVVLNMFMCLCSCLLIKYLWKVLKTTSSLKWVWNNWNFATSNYIWGKGLLQCYWNLRVMSIFIHHRVVQLVDMWLCTQCLHNDSLVYYFQCCYWHWQWCFHGGNIIGHSYYWINFYVGVIVVIEILKKLFGLLKSQVKPYTSVGDFEFD